MSGASVSYRSLACIWIPMLWRRGCGSVDSCYCFSVWGNVGGCCGKVLGGRDSCTMWGYGRGSAPGWCGLMGLFLTLPRLNLCSWVFLTRCGRWSCTKHLSNTMEATLHSLRCPSTSYYKLSQAAVPFHFLCQHQAKQPGASFPPSGKKVPLFCC